jgi:capsular exopolysaccharide synthesis family protein
MDFWRMLHILLRRKWVIAAAGILTAVAAVVAGSLMGSFYHASVMLLPSEAALQSTTSLNPTLQAPEGGAGTRQARLDNLVALARDPALAGRVADRMTMEGMPTRGDRLLREISVSSVGDAGQPTAIVRIDVQGQEPEYVRAAADIWATEFTANYRRMVAEGVRQTVDFLTRQRDSARKQLENAEDGIAGFRLTHGFVAMDEEKGRALNAWATRRAEWQTTMARLADVGTHLAWVNARVASTPATRTELEKTDQGTLAQQLQEEINKQELRLTMELATKTENHWDVQPIKQRLDYLRQRLKEEQGKMQVTRKELPNPEYGRLLGNRASLEEEKGSLEASLARLEKAIKTERLDVGRFTNTDIAMARLQRERQLAEGRYMMFASRLGDALLQRQITQERKYISRSPLARAQVGVDGPNSRAPAPVQLGLVGLLVGCGLGIAAIIGLDMLDTSVRTQLEAEALVGLPVSGLIPRAEQAISPTMLPQITHLAPTSPHAEAYRFLGTDLLLTAAQQDVRVVMVATAKPGQGGTSTVANLAITMAQAGKQVVLVDADLRRPRLHHVFQRTVEPGLSSVLSNGVGPEAVLQSTDVENLRLLSAGPCPENPWQLLKSQKMADVIAALRGSADFVFIDTPSALVFADALALTSYVDGVVLVIRAREAATGRELQIKHLLNRANAPILGVVLNDVAGDEVDAYRYHHHYYARRELPRPGLPARRDEDTI